VSQAASHHPEGPRGDGLLPRELTEAELDDAPVLESADTLLIDDLTAEEYESFMAALSS